MDVRDGLLGGLLAVLLAAPLAGCGALAQKADCVPELSYAGQVYRQVGYTSVHDQLAGQARLAYCDDTGRRPRGSVIDSSSPQVDVYTLSGFDTAQVVVHSVSGDLYQVFVAKGLSASEVAKIKKSDLLRTG